jgi:hypothetical protein
VRVVRDHPAVAAAPILPRSLPAASAAVPVAQRSEAGQAAADDEQGGGDQHGDAAPRAEEGEALR